MIEYSKSLFAEGNEMLDTVFKDAMDIFVKELKNWSPEYQIYSEKFENIKDEIVKVGKHLYVTNADGNGYPQIYSLTGMRINRKWSI